MYTERKQKNDMPYLFLGKLTIIVLVMIALFLVVLFVMPERTVAAGNTDCRTYQIISVEITEGDSLWNLASEYYTEEFSSVSNYVTEIKRMNGMRSDTLYAGSYLLIPQYVTE